MIAQEGRARAHFASATALFGEMGMQLFLDRALPETRALSGVV